MPVGKSSIIRAAKSESTLIAEKETNISVTYEKTFAEVPVENIICKKKFEPTSEQIKLMQKFGLIEPVILHQKNENQFEIIKGENNFLIAVKSDLQKIPSIIIKCNDRDFNQIFKTLNSTSEVLKTANKTITKKYEDKTEMPVYLL